MSVIFITTIVVALAVCGAIIVWRLTRCLRADAKPRRLKITLTVDTGTKTNDE